MYCISYGISKIASSTLLQPNIVDKCPAYNYPLHQEVLGLEFFFSLLNLFIDFGPCFFPLFLFELIELYFWLAINLEC
jgi:hypothetical protein